MTLPRSDHPFAIAILVLSGAAATIAIFHAIAHKPWVVLHTFGAYALIWALLVSYGIAYRARRRLLALVYWLTTMALAAVLCFVLYDDMPERLAWDEDARRLVMRPEAPYLAIAAMLNVAWALLLTIHAWWLQLRRRPEVGAAGPAEEAPADAS